MATEKITFHQSAYSIVLFCFGSSVIMGISSSANQDGWISIILATICIIPVFLMHARIIKLFPEKNYFEIIETVLGKKIGKIITALMLWYSVHLAALVLCNFGEFIQVFDMPETPKLSITILMILTTVYLARSGMRSIGKWSVVGICFLLFVVLFTFATSVHQMHFENLLPVMEASPSQILKSSFEIFTFPYGESVIFLCVADSFHKKDNPYRVFFLALAIVLPVFLTVFIRNLALLGLPMINASYFPSYIAVRIIEIGDFFARIESSISSNFILAGIVKIAICLLAASKGIVSLFGLQNNRVFIMPVGMLALALSSILYTSTMEMFIFLDYYMYYALPFQIIIPLGVWIVAEFKRRKKGQMINTPEDASL